MKPRASAHRHVRTREQAKKYVQGSQDVDQPRRTVTGRHEPGSADAGYSSTRFRPLSLKW